jgi:CRISPR-associated protein Cas2
MRFVVAYDVKEDDRRARVSAYLQTIGDRIQYSVFLCDASESEVGEVMKQCRASVNPATDSIYILRQCDPCWDGKQVYGQAQPPERTYYWAVL